MTPILQKHYFVVQPSPLCPFHVEALQYVPARSMASGYTLILLHATSLHKETFDSFLTALLGDTYALSLPIKDVWCIDSPNCGRSSSLNQELLSSDKYKFNWSAFEYARAAYSFLCSGSHGVSFRSRKLIGVAHSAGAVSLMLLHQMKLPSAFHGFMLFEPAILPPNKFSSFEIANIFGQWAKAKRDSWPSRVSAREELVKHRAYTRWDPNLVELFITFGLRETGNGEGVTLACSKYQEEAYFLINRDCVGGLPAKIFREICQAGKIPIHLFAAEDSEFRAITKDVEGFQIENVKKTPCGSVIWMKGGHMLPQVAPKVLAEKVAQVLLNMQAQEGNSKAKL